MLDQRTQFISLYLGGEWTMAALCREFGISRQQGYTLVARYHADGPRGLHDRSSAPHTHPNAIPDAIVQRIVALRKQHETWGARKLRAALLREDEQFPWPAASTITEILDRHGLLVHQPRRRPAPTATPTRALTQAQAPNDVWCLDFKGWFTLGDGTPCHPFTLTDNATRFLLRCHALPTQAGAGVRPVLDAAFREYGVPRVIRSDNGTPFASTGLGGLSRLSLWWLKLGIRPERITPGCPQQNGRHERFHRTLADDLTRHPAATLRAQHRAFQTYRHVFNEERPHEALGNAVPADYYTRSSRPYRRGVRPFSYPEDLTVRLVRPNGCLRWCGRELYVSDVLTGEYVGLEALTTRHWALHVGPLTLAVLDEATGTWVPRAEAAHLLAVCGTALEDGLSPLPPFGPSTAV